MVAAEEYFDPDDPFASFPQAGPFTEFAPGYDDGEDRAQREREDDEKDVPVEDIPTEEDIFGIPAPPAAPPAPGPTPEPVAFVPPPAPLAVLPDDEQVLQDLLDFLPRAPNESVRRSLSEDVEVLRQRISDRTAIPRMIEELHDLRASYDVVKGLDPVKAQEIADLEKQAAPLTQQITDLLAQKQVIMDAIKAVRATVVERPNDDPDVLEAAALVEAKVTEIGEWCKARSLPVPAGVAVARRAEAKKTRTRAAPGTPKAAEKRPWNADDFKKALEAGLLPLDKADALPMQEISDKVNALPGLLDRPVNNRKFDKAAKSNGYEAMGTGTSEETSRYWVQELGEY